jgi:hypothetical protein
MVKKLFAIWAVAGSYSLSEVGLVTDMKLSVSEESFVRVANCGQLYIYCRLIRAMNS